MSKYKLYEDSFTFLSCPTSKVLFDRFGPGFLSHLGFEVIGYQSQDEFKAHIDNYQDVRASAGFMNFPVQFDLIDFFRGGKRLIQSMRSSECVCARKNCLRCKNNPIISELVEHEIELPAGSFNYYQIYTTNFGDSRDLLGAAEIVFTAYQSPDPVYTRNGVDLHRNVYVPIEVILEGEKFSFQNIDGEEISIPILGRPILHDENITIAGKGMPVFGMPSLRGDLIVTIKIEFPDNISDKQGQAIAEILSDDSLLN